MYSVSHVKTSTEPYLTSFTSEKLPQSSPHQSPKSHAMENHPKTNVSDVFCPKCRRLGRHAWEIAISFPAGRLFLFRMARSKVAVVSTWDISSSRPRVITKKKTCLASHPDIFWGGVWTCFTNLNDTEIMMEDILVWDSTRWFHGISLLFWQHYKTFTPCIHKVQ